MKKKSLTLIVPIFNEAHNIIPILKALSSALSDFPHYYEVILVDDSTDNTTNIIRANMGSYKNIKLLHRSQKSQQEMTPFVAAFKKASGDYICYIEEPLDYSLNIIPGMTKKITDNASDIIIASRYVKGGVPNKFINKFYAWLGNTVSRLFIWAILKPTRKTTDPRSGLFIIRHDLTTSLPFKNINGPKILIDILTYIPDARLSEFPVTSEKNISKEKKLFPKYSSHYFIQIISLFLINRLPHILKKLVTYFIGIIILLIAIFTIAQTKTPLETFVVSLAIFLTLQSTFMIYLMVYAWENPQRIKENKSPKKYLPPKYSFAVFIPAYHEKDVIADTIYSASKLNYPEEMKEIVILINEPTDDGTIEIAEQAIKEVGKSNIKVLAFGGKTGKSEGMNIGLKGTTQDIVTIFDAEDEIHPNILNIANTTMITSRADIVQAGVQLMNFHSNWYSLFNVMEYYFWFKSVLHFFAHNGMIPLGGNTVFFKRHWLNRVGGWDESNLTEDADIGIRMSVAGARTKVVYDERHATREETPPTVMGFIKQRTRWNQGFIQTLFKGQWLKFPKMRQKLLALYILTWLFFQGMLFVMLPFAIIIALFVEMSPVLSIVVNLPLYTFLFLFIIVNIGLYEFTKSYSLKYSPLIILKTIIFYIPFQILLGVSAFRAIIRQSFGNISWEKTTHINAARKSMPKS